MPKVKNINNAVRVAPEGFNFLGTKNGELCSTSLDSLFNKINAEYPTAVNGSIKAMDEKYTSIVESVKKDIEALSSKFEKLETAFNELNNIVPIEEIAAEQPKTKKKTKKASE